MSNVILTVYDTKGEFHLRPMFCRSRGDAVRVFTDAANDKQTNIGAHPEDYAAYIVGTWDEVTGAFDIHKPECLGKAVEYVKKEISHA